MRGRSWRGRGEELGGARHRHERRGDSLVGKQANENSSMEVCQPANAHPIKGPIPLITVTDTSKLPDAANLLKPDLPPKYVYGVALARVEKVRELVTILGTATGVQYE